MANQRIYTVTQPDGAIRLVRATHRQQAVGYVASSIISARVATQDDLVEHLAVRRAPIEDCRTLAEMELIEESESPGN